MPIVHATEVFTRWFEALADRQARFRIQARIDRLEAGNPGQHRALKGGVIEMKIDYGPGYRVYCAQRGALLVILLCGGDKHTQQQNIRTAMKLVKKIREAT